MYNFFVFLYILYIWLKVMKLEMLPYKNVNLKTNKILEQLTLSSRASTEIVGTYKDRYNNGIRNGKSK